MDTIGRKILHSAPESFPSVPPDATRVWLVRHGRSTFNAQGLYQGCCDQPELTERGRLAARLAGRALASAGIRLVFSSPLRRALDTAREILDEFHRERLPVPELQTDDRLKEIDLPEWQGRPFHEVKMRFSGQYETWESQPHLFRMQNGPDSTFPVLDLFDRARLFWKDLLSDGTRHSVLVVTHGGTASALIGTALRMGPERFHSWQQSHGGISALAFPAAPGGAVIETFNSVSHLGETFPKTKAGRTGLRLLVVAPAAGDTLDATKLPRLLQRVRAHRVILYHSPSGRARLEEMIAGAGSGALVTALVVVPQQELRATVAGLLRMGEETAACFQLRPLGVTVIHYPGEGRSPVLQAVNLFDGDDGDPAGLRCVEKERCSV
jgi:broad specificity phosphatase PhoE